MSGSGINWAICKSAPRSRQITTPALHYSSFLQAVCPSCRPTNSVKAQKAKVIHVQQFNNHLLIKLALVVACNSNGRPRPELNSKSSHRSRLLVILYNTWVTHSWHAQLLQSPLLSYVPTLSSQLVYFFMFLHRLPGQRWYPSWQVSEAK